MSGITKTGYEAIAEVLCGRICERLEELEHRDVYDFIVQEFIDHFEVTFDNFDADKFDSNT